MTRTEAWAEARRLVVAEGATYVEAAQATGIPVSTVQKRAAAESWQSDREVGASYNAQIRALKAGLLAKAMQALEAGQDASQLVFAWKSAEAAYPEHRYVAPKDDPKARLSAVLELVEGLVDYLQAEDRNALAAVQPHLAGFARHMERQLGTGR